ncbi:MAG: recombinase family protein [Eubacteriales bacterium]|nr:recombinase family protein [Eubacteriales bacterium]
MGTPDEQTLQPCADAPQKNTDALKQNADMIGTEVMIRSDAKTSLQVMRAARNERIEQTRQRVRTASVKKGTIFMKARPKPSVNDEGPKVVAAYARVSTKSEEQVSSIENQTRYYTEKIEGTPDWTLQAVYADEGKSGTSMSKRTEFQRMMRDAADKKMDMILCASVSRFARNVKDCLEQIRLLKTVNPKHPIGVYFETENIYTLDPNCDQMLDMHAMLAAWESKNKSSRMILSYDQRIRMGQYPVLDLLGYRHTKDGQLVVVEEEAKTVRLIFVAYLYGYSTEQIANILTEKERKTLAGRTTWNSSMVKDIMGNERRWGDLHARKTIVIDIEKHTSIRNDDERDSAYAVGHHTGIVTPEIAKAVRAFSIHGRRKTNALPDLAVIQTGALKGFVTVCPAWKNINRVIYRSLCQRAYSEEEYALVEREARMICGDEHSNVRSMQFNGYRVPRGVYFMTSQTASMTVTHGSITFSKACVKELNCCENIELLYHPLLQAVVIRPCSADATTAIAWRNSKNVAKLLVPDFCNALYDEMDWMTEYSFRFRGIIRVRGKQKLMLFFLDEPQILVGKADKCGDADGEKTQTETQYIPYKKGNALPADDIKYAYPDEWAHERFGMTYELRKRRDHTIDTLSEEDISEQGIIVENPLFGSIPSMPELQAEIEQLLMSM